ncbi:MAG: hypothetical protein HQL28_05935, partial [Candidatus Omnitrophica bacterium]|nr:hypothetical protein [Candidatus Omnitrophota bacterium]
MKNGFIERSIIGAISFVKASVLAEEYASGKGFLQARDPILKTVAILVFLLSILLTKNIVFVGVLYLLCLALVLLSGISIFFVVVVFVQMRVSM